MKFLSILIVLLIGFSGYSQQTNYVDFKTAKVNVGIHPKAKEVVGQVAYSFDVLKPIDSLFIDAQNMVFNKVVLNGVSVTTYRYDDKKLWIIHPFRPSKDNIVTLDYTTHPKKAMYFIDWDAKKSVVSTDSLEKKYIEKQVWTQGQGKYTSNWLPSFDDMKEKVVFDLSITFDKNYEVIANGRLINKKVNDSTITWQYNMLQPMSSYLLALAIGKYQKKVKVSKSGIPLELYYYPQDSLKFEPTYRYTKHIFDFLEKEIGVSFPWQNYKEVPVKDFLYAGMENTSTTIFSDAFVIDSTAFVDKNYVNVNAHELAHQWFGDLVTETSGTHHWLQEGFATYYALLAERDVFGDNYYYWRLYEYAQELLQQDQVNQGSSLLDSKASSTTFYKRGAWALHALREKVGGEVFKKAVKSYLEKYRFKNVETNDFISEVERISGKDLKGFVATWLENKVFPYDDALENLKQSRFIQEYLMVDCEVKTSKCDDYLVSGISDKAKIKLSSQIPDRIDGDVFRNSIKVRQAIAKNLTTIPLGLKRDYESLLDDKSYITIETALYNLWVNFPDDRSKYLRKTKNIQGFNDKNIRILWLALALNTPKFEPENKQRFFDELRSYTDPNYDFNVRQNAFQYLRLLHACDSICQENLKQATKHHNWRFSKFSKNMLETIKQEKNN